MRDPLPELTPVDDAVATSLLPLALTGGCCGMQPPISHFLPIRSHCRLQCLLIKQLFVFNSLFKTSVTSLNRCLPRSFTTFSAQSLFLISLQHSLNFLKEVSRSPEKASAFCSIYHSTPPPSVEGQW